MHYVIVVPCYNEGQNIIATLKDIRGSLPDSHILIVDDRSTDDTLDRVRSFESRNISIIKHLINLGYGSAIQTGAKYASHKGYGAIVLFDADGQHSASNLPSLLNHLDQEKADVVIGSRFLGSCDYKISIPRRIGIALYRSLLKALSGLSITDPTSGLQALNQNAIKVCVSDDFSTDFPDADMLMMYSRAGLRILEVPAHFRARRSGSSMHTFLSTLYYIYKVTLSMFVIAIKRYPEAVE